MEFSGTQQCFSLLMGIISVMLHIFKVEKIQQRMLVDSLQREGTTFEFFPASN